MEEVCREEVILDDLTCGYDVQTNTVNCSVNTKTVCELVPKEECKEVKPKYNTDFYVNYVAVWSDIVGRIEYYDINGTKSKDNSMMVRALQRCETETKGKCYPMNLFGQPIWGSEIVCTPIYENVTLLPCVDGQAVRDARELVK